MLKNNLNAIILGIAAIIFAWILGSAFKDRYDHENSIKVKGLGKKDFSSDLIVWSGSFSKNRFNLKDAYAALDKDRDILKNYLVDQGIPDSSIVFSSVFISKDFRSEYDSNTKRSTSIFNGYNLSQNVTVESKNVNLVEKVSRKVSEIINSGVEFYSNSPQYYYTKLAELKIEMIEKGTEDARTRAERIAQNANSSLGDLKTASMGVFQIIGQNSSEDYSWGGAFNTTSKEKTATVTVNLEYELD